MVQRGVVLNTEIFWMKPVRDFCYFADLVLWEVLVDLLCAFRGGMPYFRSLVARSFRHCVLF
jgi:hypothetical protein